MKQHTLQLSPETLHFQYVNVQFYLIYVVFGLFRYFGCLITVRWKGAKKEVVGLGFSLTSEPITSKELR